MAKCEHPSISLAYKADIACCCTAAFSTFTKFTQAIRSHLRYDPDIDQDFLLSYPRGLEHSPQSAVLSYGGGSEGDAVTRNKLVLRNLFENLCKVSAEEKGKLVEISIFARFYAIMES